MSILGHERGTCVHYAGGYINSMSAEQTVLQAIHRLPEDAHDSVHCGGDCVLGALEQGRETSMRSE
jgi:hypothetical protein